MCTPYKYINNSFSECVAMATVVMSHSVSIRSLFVAATRASVLSNKLSLTNVKQFTDGGRTDRNTHGSRNTDGQITRTDRKMEGRKYGRTFAWILWSEEQ